MANDDRVLLGNEFFNVLCAAINVSPERVSRIIVDVAYGDAVKVYVEAFGTTKLLTLNWTGHLKAAEIKFEDKSDA